MPQPKKHPVMTAYQVNLIEQLIDAHVALNAATTTPTLPATAQSAQVQNINTNLATIRQSLLESEFGEQ